MHQFHACPGGGGSFRFLGRDVLLGGQGRGDGIPQVSESADLEVTASTLT
jgi:hypothetical protein